MQIQLWCVCGLGIVPYNFRHVLLEQFTTPWLGRGSIDEEVFKNVQFRIHIEVKEQIVTIMTRFFLLYYVNNDLNIF